MIIAEGTPTRSFTVQGKLLTIPTPYAAGHVVTENEAQVLNQTLAENVRNNIAKEIERASAEGKTDAELQQIVDNYVAEYEFGARSVRSTDPVEREALIMAKDLVRRAAKAKNIELTADAIAEHAGKLLNSERGADIRKKAAAIVKARKSVGENELDIEL